MDVKKVLTIAGSDSSGGAGIQADIKTISALGMYAESVITALTAQNTVTVSEIFPVNADFVGSQMKSVFEDIFPDSVKIGMIFTKENAEIIAEKLKYYNAKNIVCDPVMVSTSKKSLTTDEATKAIIEKLFPISTVITPNIPEAEVISGMDIENLSEMKKAARKIYEVTGTAVLVKGGHLADSSQDVLFSENGERIFEGERIASKNTHGTGCTLSSAIASYLASGESLENSVLKAKAYVTKAISAGLDIGNGNGPLWHFRGQK